MNHDEPVPAPTHRRPRPRAAQDQDGLTADCLNAIRNTASIPRTGPTGRTESGKTAKRRASVDIALITTMREGMLRRSEAAALRWRDLDFHSDGSVSATLQCSTTDSEEAVVVLGPDAASALQAIRPEAAEPAARVFGLKSERSISNRIAAVAKAAGLGEGFSDRSLRIGMLRDLKDLVQLTSHKPRITTEAGVLTRTAAVLMRTVVNLEMETKTAAALMREAAVLMRKAASLETVASTGIAALTPLGEEANIETEERETAVLTRTAAVLTRTAAALTRTAASVKELSPRVGLLQDRAASDKEAAAPNLLTGVALLWAGMELLRKSLLPQVSVTGPGQRDGALSANTREDTRGKEIGVRRGREMQDWHEEKE